jgi:hypothetical protein
MKMFHVTIEQCHQRYTIGSYPLHAGGEPMAESEPAALTAGEPAEAADDDEVAEEGGKVHEVS